MFAEEVKGNAARKRQEEAKARRRKLKQEQQRKAAAAAQIQSTASSSDAVSTVPAPISAVPSTVIAEVPSKPNTAVVSGKNAAVTNALQQRQQRQETQLQMNSALAIQSFYRAHRSNSNLLANQARLLSQRLRDLMTLRTVLQQKTTAEYIPPPATVTVLVRQLLFLTRSIPYGKKRPVQIVIREAEDIVRLNQVLQFVLLPGILGNDVNLDPLLAWSGHFRLAELIRLSLVVAIRKGTDQSVLKSINDLVRAVAGIGSPCARQVIVQECRHLLLPITPLQHCMSTANPKVFPHMTIGSSLDMIHILRHHLLFSKGDPIPSDATKKREALFTNVERAQSDVLFQLVLDMVSIRPQLQTRFLTEILTIPLLTWRITIKSMNKLLAGSPPVFLAMITSLVELHGSTLSAGKIASLLPTVPVPLSACPATTTQCLFANLVQIGRICPSINGGDSEKVSYQNAALYFNFLATLLDIIPLGTLATARDAAVEWIVSEGTHTAVVLSPVVLDQCKLILLDSYVRDLFLCAIDDDAFETDRVLSLKTDKDAKLEKDLTSTTTAASLAAKEARLDRSKGFWQSSKWAKNLTKVFAGDEVKPKTLSRKEKGPGMLVNTSSVSRKLAHGKGHDRSATNAFVASKEETNVAAAASKTVFSPDFYFSLCRAYGIILARWGGGGREDIVGRKTSEEALRYKESQERKATATLKADPCTLSLLNVLCFSTTVLRVSWALTQADSVIISELYSIIDPDRGKTPIRSLDIRPRWNHGKKENTNGAVQLLVYSYCLAHTLIVTDDVEIYDMNKPLPIHQIRRTIQLLKKLLYRACCTDEATKAASPSNYFGLALTAASARAFRDLYDRSSRRPLCVPKLWIVDDLLEKEIRRCKTFTEYESLLKTPVLRVCPFLVSFKRRLKLFERLVTTNRIDIQGQHNPNPFSSDPGLKPGIPVRIMRGRVLEDGLATMNHLGRNMRQRIVVHYLSAAGTQETGIDVGGLFKEFWTDLCAIAFNPNYALFRVTEGAGNCLYPNPSSGAAHGSDHITLFEFLGRILGKALYEGITINPKFAHFFLSFLKGDYNFLHMLPDLSTMDPQLYNNLMFLKTYEGDAEDLCLTFSVANDDFGGNKEVPLLPNGENIAVNNKNKQRYIGLVAKYHVCDRVKEQSEAFTRGLWDVIDRSWLRLFNEPELQVLISGPSDGGLDVEDMRANTRYAGGYTGLDRTVARFWKVLSSFDNEQQAALLRFVTSCERPPPLGFASMNPPFTIQRVGVLPGSDKLPTASTCFNTLKLPTYGSERVLRERLIYAIQSGAGFELT